MKNHLTALVLGLFSLPAFAIVPFTIKDIRVEGIQRTEAGTVFSYLPVKVGDTMNDEKASEAIRALYATGFFKDVRVEVEGDVLVVTLEERPAIAQVDVSGAVDIDKDALKKGLKEVGLAEGRIFDRALLDKAEQELKRQYLSRGRYGVSVTATATPMERNRVAVSFSIDEGDVAKIRQINVVGAKAFKEGDLLDLFALRTPGWMTWYTKNDQYSRQKLSGDLESLRSFYLDRGYLEFGVNSTQVSISPDKKDVFITTNVTEGEKYTVSSVKLAGQFPVPESELVKLVKIKAGETFSREKLTQTTKSISERLADEGYAFASVNAAPELDKEKRQVAFTILVDPGRRVYVRRVNISGNARTRDEVIRRELRQQEGGWYDGSKINLSKRRVDKLGFFEEVTVETPPVAGSSDQVDVNFAVKERPTGNILLGAGYSSAEKLVISGSVYQTNVLGTGKTLGAQINSGKINRVYSLSYTDPYFTLDGVALGFDVYKRNVDPSSLNIGNYRISTLGAGFRFGVPIAEEDTIHLGLSTEQTDITTFTDSPQRFLDYVNEFGNKNTSVLGTVGYTRDKRDSLIYPRSGSLHRTSGEVSLPGGSLRFYRVGYHYQRYFPLTRDLTLMLNGEVAKGDGYGDKPLPFFKNYYVGGIGSVRGYQTSSLGGRDTNGDALGGDRKVVANAELLFPLPGTGLDKSFRIAWFVDAGQVWNKTQKFDLSDMRYSSGLSLAWTSPIGPLRFSYGWPISRKPDDRLQRFQFQVGTVF